MRKFFIPLLMASAMVPAAASARDDDNLINRMRERAEAKRERASEDRPQRAERAERPSREERQVQVERSGRPVRIERAERVQRGPTLEQQQVVQTEPTQQVERVRRTTRSNDSLVEGFRNIARQEQADGTTDVRRRTDGSYSRDRNTTTRHRWSGEWRGDRRYDWRNYRDRNRSLFRIGRYYDPYGYGYRRFSIGFSLWPSYYGSNYWMNDPWQYRLPPAYGPYRWVRYYDDALLVNIYTGQVVDVLHNFFW